MKHVVSWILLLALVIPAAAHAQDAGHAPSTSTAVEAAHADETHGEDAGEHATETFLGVPKWILNLVNLFLFFGLLWWLLRGPIGRAFMERRASIQRDLAEAAERRKKSDSIAADIQARLQQIEGEVVAVLARAREEGEKQRAEMIAAAEVEAQKILAQARAEVEARTKASRQELTELARDLSIERAGLLLEKSITEEDRKRLFREGVTGIAEVSS